MMGRHPYYTTAQEDQKEEAIRRYQAEAARYLAEEKERRPTGRILH